MQYEIRLSERQLNTVLAALHLQRMAAEQRITYAAGGKRVDPYNDPPFNGDYRPMVGYSDSLTLSDTMTAMSILQERE